MTALAETQKQLLSYRYRQLASPEVAAAPVEWWLCAVIHRDDIGSLFPESQSNLVKHLYF